MTASNSVFSLDVFVYSVQDLQRCAPADAYVGVAFRFLDYPMFVVSATNRNFVRKSNQNDVQINGGKSCLLVEHAEALAQMIRQLPLYVLYVDQTNAAAPKLIAAGMTSLELERDDPGQDAGFSAEHITLYDPFGAPTAVASLAVRLRDQGPSLLLHLPHLEQRNASSAPPDAITHRAAFDPHSALPHAQAADERHLAPQLLRTVTQDARAPEAVQQKHLCGRTGDCTPEKEGVKPGSVASGSARLAWPAEFEGGAAHAQSWSIPASYGSPPTQQPQPAAAGCVGPRLNVGWTDARPQPPPRPDVGVTPRKARPAICAGHPPCSPQPPRTPAPNVHWHSAEPACGTPARPATSLECSAAHQPPHHHGDWTLSHGHASNTEPLRSKRAWAGACPHCQADALSVADTSLEAEGSDFGAPHHVVGASPAKRPADGGARAKAGRPHMRALAHSATGRAGATLAQSQAERQRLTQRRAATASPAAPAHTPGTPTRRCHQQRPASPRVRQPAHAASDASGGGVSMVTAFAWEMMTLLSMRTIMNHVMDAMSSQWARALPFASAASPGPGAAGGDGGYATAAALMMHYIASASANKTQPTQPTQPTGGTAGETAAPMSGTKRKSVGSAFAACTSPSKREQNGPDASGAAPSTPGAPLAGAAVRKGGATVEPRSPKRRQRRPLPRVANLGRRGQLQERARGLGGAVHEGALERGGRAAGADGEVCDSAAGLARAGAGVQGLPVPAGDREGGGRISLGKPLTGRPNSAETGSRVDLATCPAEDASGQPGASSSLASSSLDSITEAFAVDDSAPLGDRITAMSMVRHNERPSRGALQASPSAADVITHEDRPAPASAAAFSFIPAQPPAAQHDSDSTPSSPEPPRLGAVLPIPSPQSALAPPPAQRPPIAASNPPLPDAHAPPPLADSSRPVSHTSGARPAVDEDAALLHAARGRPSQTPSCVTGSVSGYSNISEDLSIGGASLAKSVAASSVYYSSAMDTASTSATTSQHSASHIDTAPQSLGSSAAQSALKRGGSAKSRSGRSASMTASMTASGTIASTSHSASSSGVTASSDSKLNADGFDSSDISFSEEPSQSEYSAIHDPHYAARLMQRHQATPRADRYGDEYDADALAAHYSAALGLGPAGDSYATSGESQFGLPVDPYGRPLQAYAAAGAAPYGGKYGPSVRSGRTSEMMDDIADMTDTESASVSGSLATASMASGGGRRRGAVPGRAGHDGSASDFDMSAYTDDITQHGGQSGLGGGDEDEEGLGGWSDGAQRYGRSAAYPTAVLGGRVAVRPGRRAD